ncbi:MAG TPA: PA2169 family four-helix-bundle protein [Ramlibacter sp.]|uniref:ferritin-like domain-containing protein n=1 Tax=Ramlibacter sp. TaxID=1917967 RepID=UPI002C736C41|nr:PA2169 family four-helix-bundle protein [Ramlibacter sp.]HVZ42369.1 PA2169 family four-helix-bundle protein [Ramlibacter sp.]
MNRDPITGEPGAHPVGTGVGAAGGAAAGAAIGGVGGPLGMAVGGVAGAVIGAMAGKAAAERVNPTAEEAYWRETYTREPYYESGLGFDDYGPAYRLGVTGRTRYEESDWTSVEPRLASEWEASRGGSTLDWTRASPAARAAWDRVDVAYYRTLDNTGRSFSDRAAGTGTAGAVGSMQTAGNASGDADDVVDVLQDLVECCKDGEYGFRECAEQAKRSDLKTTFLQRADDCRAGAQELNELIRQCGGKPEAGGSAMGAMHRGWVAVKAKLTSYDDKAVLEEAERGEDNAKARYAKALQKPLPAHVRQVVERQMQGVTRNHDQIRMLRDQARAAG